MALNYYFGYDENGRGRNVEEWERILVLLSNRINPNIHFLLVGVTA